MMTIEAGIWEKIVQAGTFPVCAFDTAFRITAFNRAQGDEFRRVYGRQLRVGEVIPDLVLPNEAPTIRALMTRALKGEAFRVVERFGDPDLGSPHWDIRYFPLLDARGAVVGAFHLAQDISHRLGAEVRLDEARLRFAAQAGRLGLWELDTKTMELVTSDTCREVFGRDPALPFDYPALRDSVHPEDRARMVDALERSTAAGGDCDVEVRVVRPDGETGWASLRAQVIPDGERGTSRLTGVALDSTERKRAEARSAVLTGLGDHIRDARDPDTLAFAASALLGEALDVSRVGYGTVEPERETVTVTCEWNAPGVERLPSLIHFRDYGSYIEDLVRGETVVLDDVTSDPRTSGNVAALRRRSTLSFVNLPLMEQGRIVAIFYLLNAKARRWTPEDLELIRVVAERVRTASARLQAERELQDLASSLERQVEARTAAQKDVEDQLRQSQKMEAIGQLTGGVAHDFNNLLTVIRGSVELLQRPGLSEDRRLRYVDAIGQTADRAAKLTGQLLAFARRQALRPETFELGEAVDSIMTIVKPLIGSRIELRTRLADEPCYVCADRGQFDTAIVNLAVNARDAMQGAGRLVLSTGPAPGLPANGSEPAMAGDFVALAVEDTGTGISADALARIFEPFYTTKPVGSGTGLGLSQVIGFAKQSGGDVRVESRLGEGATFILYLPRVAAPRAAPVRDGGPEAAAEGRGVRVLIVEDNPEVGEFATQALRELGYATVLADNAEHALAMIEEQGATLDVVFSDVVMPGQSGVDLGTLVRANHPDLPVILTSGYSHVLAQNGGYGFELLHKPYSIEQLARVLSRALAWRRRMRDRPSVAEPAAKER